MFLKYFHPFYVQLISILRKMNFTVDNQTYSFNKDGDFENGYDLIMWKKDGDERVLDVVGKFLIRNNDVDVCEHKIVWFNNTVRKKEMLFILETLYIYI